jgi:hypothetical protein
LQAVSVPPFQLCDEVAAVAAHAAEINAAEIKCGRIKIRQKLNAAEIKCGRN